MFLSRPLTARLRPRLLVGVAAGLALSALGTVALATDSPSSSGTITACVKKNGQVRFVSSASQCKRNETATIFNVNGASGPPGPPGPTGPQGPAGPTGPAGSAKAYAVVIPGATPSFVA